MTEQEWGVALFLGFGIFSFIFAMRSESPIHFTIYALTASAFITYAVMAMVYG